MSGYDANYVAATRHIVDRLLILLDGKLILTDDPHREDPENCRESAQDLRGVLTAEMLLLAKGGPLLEDLRALRMVCENFVKAAGQNSARFGSDPSLFWHHLTVLRELFSQRLGILVDEYGVVVTPRLQALIDLAR